MRNFWSAVLLLLALIASAHSVKLNYPRILLPIFNNENINFTLQVQEKGCFSWSASRSDLITITPIFEENASCSYQAVVTTKSKVAKRNTAIVLAEDKATGEVLRCDVILDLIHSLGVLTTTRELYLEEAPETFELWAQDSQGNAFSTLEGVEFNWEIMLQNSNNANWNQVLKFMRFADSAYHTVPKDIENFELAGIQGYKILIEGINTGSAKVLVKLPHSEYRTVPSVEVEINVLANLLIDPSDVHILVGDNINFRVLQLKQGKLHEVSLSKQYYLEIETTSYAKISGNVATGLEVGQTFVVLRDRNVAKEETSDNPNKPPAPRASLTVSIPDKIALSLLPHNNWVTVEGEHHDIAIDLFTNKNQKITLGDKYKFKSTFDVNMFLEERRNKNASRIFGEAVTAGSNPITASFENLKTNAEMLVFKGIDLYPKLVLLPYDTERVNLHKVQFVATGGDGSFVWSGSDTNVQVNKNGLAEAKFDRHSQYFSRESLETTGIAASSTVQVALTRNKNVFKQAQVLFLAPVKLTIVDYNFETALHDYVNVYISLYGLHNGAYQAFTSCDGPQFDAELTQRIFEVVSHKQIPNVKDSCKLIRLKGVTVGTTNLRVTYKFGDQLLKAEVTLNVFEPLSIFNPESNEVVLPIGSSRNVFYQNGPQKVSYSLEAELIKNTEFNKDLVGVEEVTGSFTSTRLIFNILCRKVGVSKFKILVHNALDHDHYTKYVSEFETTIYCVKPRFIHLYTSEKLKTSCPIDGKNSLMHVRSLKNTLDIEIEVLDANNRKLDNITSLEIDWQFSQANGELNSNIPYELLTETEEIDGVEIPNRVFLKTSITDINMNHKIRAVVQKYNHQVLKKHQVEPEIPNFGIQKGSSDSLVTPLIESVLNFLSFDSSLLPYTSTSIFLAKSMVERVRIGHGSGFYDIKVVDENIVNVEYDEKTRELVLKPLRMGDTKVKILDQCLKTEPSELLVRVVSIGKIAIDAPDRVEKTKQIEGIVRIFDTNHNLLNIDPNNLKIYEMTEDVQNKKILKLKQGDQDNLNRGEIRYIITGSELGETKITVNSGSGLSMISSLPVTVQVFPPLMLFPRNATILVGSMLEVTSRGGPKPDSNIVYKVISEDVLSIDGSVVQGLKVGKTKVVGQSVGINPSTGNKIVFSEDVIYVNVVPLTGIKIQTPLRRLRSDAVMPASIWAQPDISPLVLGTLKNLNIVWTTDQPDILEIKGRFDDMGVVYDNKDSISVRVRGLKQGKAKIFATLYVTPTTKFQATSEVTIFKTLELESPKRIVYDPIIIPPRTTLQLKTNLDEAFYDLSDTEDRDVINVSRDGIVRSSEALGRSLVVATSVDQKLSIPIEVKSIHYVLAKLQNNHVTLKQVENELPQKLNIVLKVTLHDNLGNEFSHDFNDLNYLKYKLSKKDAVDVHIGDNFTLSLNLMRESSNILVVTLKDSAGIKYPEDFIKLAVRASPNVFPTKTIFSVTDIICFKSPLTGTLQWHSSDEKAVQIKPHTGVARLVSVPTKFGKAVVSHGTPGATAVTYDLDIHAADKIEFLKNFDIFNGETYKGHIVIGNHLQQDKISNLIVGSQNVTGCFVDVLEIDFFDCKLMSREKEINVVNKFSTRAVFDREVGSYACEIKLLTSLEDLTSVVKHKNLNLELQARLPTGVSDIIQLRLTPAVDIMPRIISMEKASNQEITLTGLDNILQKVEVSSSNPNSLQVTQVQKSAGQLHFKTKLLDSENHVDLYVQINSPMTHQNVQIPIVNERYEKKCALPGSEVSDWSIIGFITEFGKIIALSILLCTLAYLVFRFVNRDKYDPDSIIFQSPNSSSNGTLRNPSPSFTQPFATPRIYKTTSPYHSGNTSMDSTLNNTDEQVYGDTVLMHSNNNKRINRRNM